MKPTINFLMFIIIIAPGVLIAQTTVRKDSLRYSKRNLDTFNNMGNMKAFTQDSTAWYKKTDSILTTMNRMQKDSMMKTMSKGQRDGMVHYRNKLQKDSIRVNKNYQRIDSIRKSSY